MRWIFLTKHKNYELFFMYYCSASVHGDCGPFNSRIQEQRLNTRVSDILSEFESCH